MNLVERSCKSCGLKFKVLPESSVETCSKYCTTHLARIENKILPFRKWKFKNESYRFKNGKRIK
jgi:hypothetical protein